jgi:hypothetical protein
MANKLYNKQVSPKGYQKGGSVKKDYKLGTKFQGDYKGKSLRGKAKEFVKTAAKQTVGTAKEIGKKFRTKKMGGGMMMKRPMMKKGGKLKMVKNKEGKMVPFYAADGVGKMKKGGMAKLNPGLRKFMMNKMKKKGKM